VIEDDGSDGDTFEILQAMSDEPLTHHPETGSPVRRLIGVPNAPRKWTDSQGKSNLSSANLERLGFTQYKKAGDGKYEKSSPEIDPEIRGMPRTIDRS
jgi:hypothetical protein